MKRLVHLQDERCGAPDHLTEINRALIKERLIDQSLSLEDARGLVDIHTHEQESKIAGLRPDELILHHFSKYGVEVIRYTDYGGEMLRSHRWLRCAVDAVLRAACARRGMLFSLILRKPFASTMPNKERE